MNAIINSPRKMRNAASREICEDVVARDLPHQNGRSPKLKPREQNTIDRMLQPPKSGNTNVDIRNLGDIICVKVSTELLRWMPPKERRPGYTVT
jgi:uncharacterized protein (DUF342 family)